MSLDQVWLYLQQVDLAGMAVATLDILLVAFLIYRVLLLIRGTSAAYILLGLLLLAGLFFGANYLSLSTVSWLLDHLISYFIIIIIIVFQADIRRGLSRMGRRMFSSSAVSEDISAVERVVEACEALSGTKTGALIVFERDAALSEFIEPGTVLDARVSMPLLLNIFTPWPDNALHDGAVIIKNGWLLQAGAVLPLSRNPGLDKDLGTRHRAAIGITEETDAIAVVVSEQRGSISLCEGGLLHMSLTGPSLRRELLAQLSVGEGRRWGWLDRILKRLERWFNSSGAPRPVSRPAPPPGERPVTGPHPRSRPEDTTLEGRP